MKRNLGPIVLAIAGLMLGALPIGAGAAVPPSTPVVTAPTSGTFPAKVTMTGTHPVAGLTIKAREGTKTYGTATVDLAGNWKINMTNLPDGTRTIQVVAVDATNTESTPAIVSIRVDAKNPTVTVDQVTPSTFLPGDTYEFTGTAADNIGVVGVSIQLYNVAGNPMGKPFTASCPTCGATATSVAWTADPPEPPTGAYSIQIVATDEVANKSVPETPSVSTGGIHLSMSGTVVFAVVNAGVTPPPVPTPSASPSVPDVSPPPVPSDTPTPLPTDTPTGLPTP